jgi:Galactosyltransferase
LDLLLFPTTTKGGNSPNETTLDDCQIAYTFVIVGNQEGASLDNKSILEENAMHNDVLLLPYNADDPKMMGRADSELSSQFSFSDNSRHTQLAQSLAWFHYATTNHHLAETVRFDYIAKLDDDVILLPDWFRSVAPNRTHTTSYNKTSTTTATWIESGSVFAATRTKELRTEFCALNRNFCPDFIGKFYFMSPSIASHVLTSLNDGTFCHDCNQTLLHSELLLHPNDESIAIRMPLSSLSSSSSSWVDHSAVPILPGGGALPLQINGLPRLLRKHSPYHWWKSWQTYENAVSQWDRLQSTYNSSVVHVSGKFARNDTVLFDDQVTFSTTVNMMLGGLSSDQSKSHYKFPDYILQDPTWTKHTAFLINATITDRGGGYWFWKGPLIHHQLVENRNLHDGDFVIYTDVDVNDHWQWMYHLLETMIDSNQTLALYQTNFLERKYCKRDVFKTYCGSKLKKTGGSLQYSANFIVVRNRLEQFSWFRIGCKAWRIIN